MTVSNWTVYLLQCSDGTFYCGATNNLEQRLAKHNAGKASRYTRARLPVIIVYIEGQDSKSAALKREHAIKKLGRKQKLELVKSQNER